MVSPRSFLPRLRRLLPLLLGTALAASAQVPEQGLDRRVEELLARMTLEEKIGQMTLLPEAREEYLPLIRQGRVGALLGTLDTPATLMGAEVSSRMQRVAVEESRLKIPLLMGYDVLHGYRTIFPIPLGEAASWDPQLVEQAAAVAARESRAAGVNWTFAPMVDIARDPRWGRIAEGSGEDPYLGAGMAAARVRGFQGNDPSAPDRVLACVKHFVGYGAVEAGREYNTTDISERTLREVYLPPFQAAVEAGVGSLMTGFNDLNGVPASGNRFTLEQILRREWNFHGFAVSDWESVLHLVTHGVAVDRADAARQGVLAGVDMDMSSRLYLEHLPQLVKEGRVPEEAINEAVRRILRQKFRLGLFQNPYADPERERATLLAAEHLQLARLVAQKSIVLLKNDKDLLPLSKDLKTVAVLGPLADSAADMLGSWPAQGRAQDAVTLVRALSEKLPNARILFAKGAEFDGGTDAAIEQAVALAKQAQVAILAVGEAALMSGEAASRAYLDLPGRQRELVEAVQKTGVPVVMVLMNGRPLTIEWAAESVPAILETWFLGVQAGPAIADVLFGDYNPGGKLPVTFPRTVGQIPIYYNARNTGRPEDPKDKWSSRYLDVPNTPLFPFGYGLSYARFRYSNLTLSSKQISREGTLTISVEVENVGKRLGDEVAQLYVRDLVGSVTRPVKQLKGFRRVTLKPGEKQRVEFFLPAAELGLWNRAMEYVVEPGEFKLWVGTNSADERLEASFVVR